MKITFKCLKMLKRKIRSYRSKKTTNQKNIIIEKQAKAKTHAKIFACRRCSIKYFNNIQLHKHIDEHHIKRFKLTKFDVFTSIQDHKTSSSSFSKASLMISFSTMILNQAFISFVTFSSQMSITASITSSIIFLTSSQIT